MPEWQCLNDFSAGGQREKSLLLVVSVQCLLPGMDYLVVTVFCTCAWTTPGVAPEFLVDPFVNLWSWNANE